MNKKQKRRPPGPEADRLKIDDDWRNAMARAIKRKPPAGGIPAAQKRKKV